MMTSPLAFLLLLAYLLGSIPTGLILSRRFAQTDIRDAGSGNIGATNVARVLGPKLGAWTLLGDALKGTLPTLLALLWLHDIEHAAWVGVAAMLGHCFSIFLRFRGGKGIAVALGVLLVLIPKSIPMLLTVWGLVFLRYRKSSLAGLTATGVLFGAMLATPSLRSLVPSVGMMTALIVVRHKDNIARLIQGREL